MLTNRFFISYATTSFLYIMVIVGVIHYMPSTKRYAHKDIETKVIRLKVANFVPKVITPIEQIAQEEKKREVEKVKEPIKIKEPSKVKEIIKKSKPKPILKKKKILKKPKKVKRIKKRQKKIYKKKQKKSNKIKRKSKKISKYNRVKKVASRKNRRVSPAKKSAFLSKIRASINRAKSYPNMAMRRGIEGRVKVRFTILKSGRVGGITVSGARVFRNSAKRAVRSAFPINARKAPLVLPMSLSVTLIYKIR